MPDLVASIAAHPRRRDRTVIGVRPQVVLAHSNAFPAVDRNLPGGKSDRPLCAGISFQFVFAFRVGHDWPGSRHSLKIRLGSYVRRVVISTGTDPGVTFAQHILHPAAQTRRFSAPLF
jgi:hypothetical protein